ncbi:hypothetical protein ABH546_25035 [Escherichia coli]
MVTSRSVDIPEVAQLQSDILDRRLAASKIRWNPSVYATGPVVTRLENSLQIQKPLGNVPTVMPISLAKQEHHDATG